MNPYRQLPGDILLVRGDRFTSSLNVFAQRLLRGMAPCSFSHALLSLGPGLFIHSDKGPGVSLICFDDLHLGSHYRESWRVLRKREVEEDAGLRDRIFKTATFHFAKSYNKKFFLKRLLFHRRRDSSAFCSELIARVYADLRIALVDRRPESVLPIDFERLLYNPGWKDVTVSYREPWVAEDRVEIRTECEILINMVKASFASTQTQNKIVEQLGDFNRKVNHIFGWLQSASPAAIAREGLSVPPLEEIYERCYRRIVSGPPQMAAGNWTPVNWIARSPEEIPPVDEIDELPQKAFEILQADTSTLKSIDELIRELRVVKELARGGSEVNPKPLRSTLRHAIEVLESFEGSPNYESELSRLRERFSTRLASLPRDADLEGAACKSILAVLDLRQALAKLRLGPRLVRLRDSSLDAEALEEFFHSLDRAKAAAETEPASDP